jgi:phage major head subunit gpT-like protein
MDINSPNLAYLRRTYSAQYRGAYNQATPQYERVATIVPSDGESVTYSWMGQFPHMRKRLGGRIVKKLAAHAYTLVNERFESTVGVDADKIADDRYQTFGTMMQEMGYAAKLHPDELTFALTLLGATNLCYDGQPFFNASHPVVVAGAATVASNYDATGGGAMWVLLDTKHPLKPFIYQKRMDYQFVQLNQPNDANIFLDNEILYGVDGRGTVGFGLWQMAYASLNTLNATNYDAAVTAMMGYKSDEGSPLGIKPDLLLIGPSNRVAARNLILKEFLAGGENNPNFKEVDILDTPYMV